MTHSYYFRLLTSFMADFLGNFHLFLLCGDIELNPGWRPNSPQTFSIFHSILIRKLQPVTRWLPCKQFKIPSLDLTSTMEMLFMIAHLTKFFKHLSITSLWPLWYIPKVFSTRITRNHNNIPLFSIKHEFFQNSFFPSTVI